MFACCDSEKLEISRHQQAHQRALLIDDSMSPRQRSLASQRPAMATSRDLGVNPKACTSRLPQIDTRRLIRPASVSAGCLTAHFAKQSRAREIVIC